MSRGNWRSGEGHGPAETGSAQRVFDGWTMRVAGRFDTEKEADQVAGYLQSLGLQTRVIRGRTKWAVWRTYRKGQVRLKE